MTVVPKCHICNNGKSLKLSGAYRCCGCGKYICKRHHNPRKPWPTYFSQYSFCTECNPTGNEGRCEKCEGAMIHSRLKGYHCVRCK